MDKIHCCHVVVLIMTICLLGCRQDKEDDYKKTGGEIVSLRALPFENSDVKLLEGPFKKATELNVISLLNYEPDRFLAKFRTEAGLTPKAEHYHGWEDNTIAGHSLGHYLSACAIMYQATGNPQFLERVNYIVDELDSCQVADSTGYIGAIPGGKKILEEEVANGVIRSSGFNLNGIWVPFYTYHKVMAGLRDAFHLCNNNKALEIEKKFAGWIESVVLHLPDSSMQKILNCEHGGISEVLAELYGDTGNEKYLALSEKFHHKAILDSLLSGIDILPGKHANTQIPKLIGLARRYELAGDTNDRKTAEYFWNRVVNHHSYVTGGNCNYEHFGPPDKLRDRLGPKTTESCNVYNMLKLTNHIFSWTTSVKAADYYERALFNHILVSQHPANGRVVYNLSLDMGGSKEYQDPYAFTCCVGTGMENHAKYGEAIYFYNANELFVNQFIASELTWKEKGMVLTQNTNFPEEQGTTITLKLIRPADLNFYIRYPDWAENGIKIIVNGKIEENLNKPGSFIKLTRKWKNNDKIEVQIPFSLRLESMPDDKNRVAVMYGPLLLAGDLGPENDPNMSDHLYVPVFITRDRDPANWTEPVQGKINEFLTRGVGKPRDVLLKPFYLTHERTYSVYWDLFTPRQWENWENDHNARQARKKRVESITYDFFQAGNTISEQKYNLKSEHSRPGKYKTKPYRESRNGWFSYELKVPSKKPTALIVEYWGGYPGNKTFDILVNNTVIATENLSSRNTAMFIDIQYVIPEELTRGKKKITVKFIAHENHTAGPVFGVRIVTL